MVGSGTYAGTLDNGETMPISYQLRLAADEGLIQSPDDPLAAMMAAWQTQYDLQLARNKPFLLLINTSPVSDAELTRFTMTVGKAAYHFDLADVVAVSSGADANIAITMPGQKAVGGEVIELELSNFTQDAFVLFQIGLAPDADDVFPLSDFRTVLFDANGDDTSDNAVVAASFETSDGDNATTLSGPLEDFEVQGPVFVGPAFHAYETMDHVGVFTHRDEGDLLVDRPVPEPSALVELLLGLGGLIACSRRSRVIGKKAYHNDSLSLSIG